MTTRPSLNGYDFGGYPISKTKHFVVTTLSQLMGCGVWRPTSLAKRMSKGDGDGSAVKAPNVQDRKSAQMIRELTNRSFTAKRKKNALDYMEYILAMNTQEGFVGDCPPINLYATTKRSPHVTDDGHLILPFDTVMTAFDGETQTEARFLLRDRLEESEEWPFPAIIYYNTEIEHIRQFLHDFNQKGMRISDAVLSTHDSMGVVSVVIKQALEQASIDEKEVKVTGNTLGKKHLVSHQQCRAFSVGYLKGQDGLTQSASSLITPLNRLRTFKHMAESVGALTEVLEQIKNGEGEEIREATVQVWQCAGVKARLKPNATINWKMGKKSFAKSKVATMNKPGGEKRKLTMKEKLAVIYDAM